MSETVQRNHRTKRKPQNKFAWKEHFFVHVTIHQKGSKAEASEGQVLTRF
jgi:hypothetical protein